MKATKQIAVIFLVIAMALSLAACGGSEQTVVLKGDMSAEMGVPTTDTWTITAKGDVVQTIKEVFELDLSEYDDDARNVLISTFESLIIDPAKDIDGVVCTGQLNGTTYTIEMTVECKGDAVKEAAELGILTIDGNAEKISLKQTQASLEGQGYKVVE